MTTRNHEQDGGPPIAAGKHVVTADGEELGTLKEIEGAYFKVSARLQKDYWLCTDDVSDVVGDDVLVTFAKDSLDEHRFDQPVMRPEDDPFRDVAIAPVLTEDDLLDQRARMERELADQSKRLPRAQQQPTATKEREDRATERIPADHAGFGDHAGEVVEYAPAADEDSGAHAGETRPSDAEPMKFRSYASSGAAAEPQARPSTGGRPGTEREAADREAYDGFGFEAAGVTVEGPSAPGPVPARQHPTSAESPPSLSPTQTPLRGEERAPSAAAFPSDAGVSAPYAPMRQQPAPPPLATQRRDLASFVRGLPHRPARDLFVGGLVMTLAAALPVLAWRFLRRR